MNRRSFLRGMTGFGSAVLAGATAAGCATGGPARPTTTTARAAAPEWQELAGALTGALVRPGEPGFDSAGHLYNALYTPHSAAIAQCASTSDVQRCFAFVRKYDLQVAAHSGGHSYGGYSSCPGLVIDVSRLNQVSAPSDSQTVKVGAGALLIDTYSALEAQGLLLPGGSCPTVGIAGLALGGGNGVFSRAYGLTCDQTAAVDIVTPDGMLRRCSPGSDEDLYWACRGGGGGNFGVVTSFEFRAHPIPDAITLFTLEWPWGAAPSVLDTWTHWIAGAPSELWANCQLFSSGSAGDGLVKVTGVFVGTVARCTSALSPLQAGIGEATTYRFVGPEDYMTAVMIEAGCEGEPVAQCATPVESPFVAKSSYMGSPLPDASVSAIITALSDFPTIIPGGGAGVVFDGYGGVINETRPDQTAFVHRDAVACAQYSITYPNATPSAATEGAAAAWLDGIHRAFADVSQGSYQNYIDPTLTDWQEAYYGNNLPRLRQVKQKYDPENLFHFAQSIPLA